MVHSRKVVLSPGGILGDVPFDGCFVPAMGYLPHPCGEVSVFVEVLGQHHDVA